MKNTDQKIRKEFAGIKTKENEVIMIFPEGKNQQSWSIISENPLANEKVKYHSSGKTQLGIPRMF